MRDLKISLTREQAAFAFATDEFPAIVAGYGSGKTEAAGTRMMVQKICNPLGCVAYYAPSYDSVSQVGWPRIERMLEENSLPYKTNHNKKRIYVRGYGQFLFRSMEKPSSLVGYEHADAVIDELDTLREAHAKEAWEKIIARNRQKKPGGALNSVAVATTPEGFRFTYKNWKKEVKEGFKLYTASTYSNLHNLPANYIASLQKNYSPALLRAYLMGEFVNLTSGSIYPDFDRVLNGSTATLNAGEGVHIGLDFNVYKMAAVASVIRDNAPIAIGEFTKVRDTPAMIEQVKTRYGDKGRSISVYPDASGQATSSKSASVSDILLLRQAGFNVQALSTNPPVKDRIASVNGLILNSTGQRRLRVNVPACPNFTEALEQQTYTDGGDPDKKSGLDHITDAGGYFLYRRWPVGRNALAVLQLNGH